MGVHSLLITPYLKSFLNPTYFFAHPLIPAHNLKIASDNAPYIPHRYNHRIR